MSHGPTLIAKLANDSAYIVSNVPLTATSVDAVE
jgi:hypothetical protein